MFQNSSDKNKYITRKGRVKSKLYLFNSKNVEDLPDIWATSLVYYFCLSVLESQ